MGTKLLLISEGSTFMVDAIVKNLKEAGFEVVQCNPIIKDIKEHEDDADILLIYLGDYVESRAEDMVYLKDVCIEKEKIINVIGDKMELEELKRTVPEGMISNYFSRPLDIKNLVSVMQEVANEAETIGSKKSILVVDDDATFLKMVKDWLDNDYRVTIVNSGMQAITYIAKNTPDLILLDFEMPVTTGPKVLEMIRSESATATIPVIFLTGKDDKESVTSVLSLKPEGYILKSAGKEKLLEQIANFFESRKMKSF